MKHVLRILAVAIILAPLASCYFSVTAAPQDISTEIEEFTRVDRGGEDSLVLITPVLDYIARFGWKRSGQLSDGRHWATAHAGDYL